MAQSGERPTGARVSIIPPAERNRAVDVLTRGYADDRLTEAELEARLDRVYRAATLADVHAAVADLVTPPAPVAAAEPSAAAATTASAPPTTRTADGVPAAVATGAGAALVRAPLRISALLSGREQSLAGVAPDRVRIRALLSHIELDLSGATFEPGVNVIDIRAFMGHVLVRLPANVRVESDGRGILGFFALKGAGSSDSASPCVVRVTGRTLFGHVECQVVGGGDGANRIGPGATE